jgi:hypothetical protein
MTTSIFTRCLAQLAKLLGLAVKVPNSLPGDHVVSSLHFRIPNGGPFTQIFYPANPHSVSGSSRRNYVRSGVATGIARFAGVPSWLFHMFMGAADHHLDPELDPLQDLTTTTTTNTYPIIIFQHGLGGNAEIYSSTCSHLASFGNVVIALESEDGSGSFALTEQGGVVEYKKPPNIAYQRDSVVQFRAPFLTKRCSEVQRIIDYLVEINQSNNSRNKTLIMSNSLAIRVLSTGDLQNVFLSGHSFGAAGTVKASQEIKSPIPIKGLLLLDIWSFPLSDFTIQQGIHVPFMNLLSVPFIQSSEYQVTQRLCKTSSSMWLNNWVIPQSVHSSFSDAAFWLGPRFLSFFAKRALLRGEADPMQVLESISLMSDLFIRSLIKGDDLEVCKHKLEQLAIARGIEQC